MVYTKEIFHKISIVYKKLNNNNNLNLTGILKTYINNKVNKNNIKYKNHSHNNNYYNKLINFSNSNFKK